MAGTRRGNHEGTITKRADGRWEARISFPLGRRKSVYGATREEVAEQLVNELKALRDGLTPAAGRLTVAKYLQGWLEACRPNVKARTWRRYEELVRHHLTPRLGTLPLTRLRPGHCEALAADMIAHGLSGTTARHAVVVLGTALQRAVRQGLIPRNPVRLVDKPRAARPALRVLTVEEATAFLEAAREDRFEALYVLAVTCGLRRGELLGLRWPNVNLVAGTITVQGTLQRHPKAGLVIEAPKTAGSVRTVHVPPLAIEALRRHRVRQFKERAKAGSAWGTLDLVFPNEIGAPMEAGNLLRRSFIPILAKAGLAEKVEAIEQRQRRGKTIDVRRIELRPLIRFHDLRHSAATLLLAAGEPATIVAAMLGHARPSTTTDIYGHVVAELTRSTAARMQDLLSGNKPKAKRKELSSRLSSRAAK